MAAATTPIDHAPADTLGRTLVEAGVLTSKQLAYAQRVHAKLGVQRPLFTLLRELFPITDVQLRTALREATKTLRIGDLLVELGHLRPEFLELALAIQRGQTPRKRLGEILIEHDLLEEAKLVEVLALHLGYPLEAPGAEPIDAALLDALPLAVCEQHSMVPLRTTAAGVVVAFFDPTDECALAAAEAAFGRDRVVAAIAERGAIRGALDFLAGRCGPSRAGAAPPPAIVDLLDELIEDALAGDASAIHLEPRADGLVVRQREGSQLVVRQVLPLSLAPALGHHLRFLARSLDAPSGEGVAHFLHQRSERSVCVSIAQPAAGQGGRIVLRLTDASAARRSLDALGLPEALLSRLRRELATGVGGLWLVAGPIGSGRSTSFHAVLGALAGPQTAIATLEDEPLARGDGALQLRKGERCEDVLALALRHDPDVIGIDELAHGELARRALALAAAGRHVVAVLGANDAARAVLVLASQGTDRALLAATLGGVLAQRLLRRVCPSCAQPDTSRAARRLAGHAGADARFRVGRGCDECRGSGHQGRVALFELMVPDAQTRAWLASGDPVPPVRSSLFEHAVASAAGGLVSAADVLHAMGDERQPHSASPPETMES